MSGSEFQICEAATGKDLVAGLKGKGSEGKGRNVRIGGGEGRANSPINPDYGPGMSITLIIK